MARNHDIRDTLPDASAFEQFDTLPGVLHDAQSGVPWAFCRGCGLLCQPATKSGVPFCEECLSASQLDPFSDEYGTLGGGD
jgi:hypothetical protein